MSGHTITRYREKWRFECLISSTVGDSHTNWFPINGHFRCRTCADLRAAGHRDVSPEYNQLRDKTTGELVGRGEIMLDIQQGPAVEGAGR